MAHIDFGNVLPTNLQWCSSSFASGSSSDNLYLVGKRYLSNILDLRTDSCHNNMAADTDIDSNRNTVEWCTDMTRSRVVVSDTADFGIDCTSSSNMNCLQLA